LKPRVRVKAWRRLNEDNPAPMVALERATKLAFMEIGLGFKVMAKAFDGHNWNQAFGGNKSLWPSS
jgi:hypothetical protein